MRIPTAHLFDGYDTVYIKHTKEDGTEYTYEGTVRNGAVEFENPDGFSQFVISTSESGQEVIHVQELYLNTNYIELVPGGSKQLEAYVYPEEAANRKVLWSSSDDSVAAVDDTGLVTAVGNGEAIITAETEDSGLTADCTVNVVTPVKPTELHFNSKSVTGIAGHTSYLSYSRAPYESRLYPLDVTVSDPSVVRVDTVSEYGMDVTWLKAGTVTITIAADDVSDTMTANVIEGDYADNIWVVDESGWTNYDSVFLFTGEQHTVDFKLESNAEPWKTEFADEKITVSFSDPDVVRDNGDGTYTALKAGSTLMEAAITNGKTASVNFIVSDKPLSVQFREDADYRIPTYKLRLNIGDYVISDPEVTSWKAFDITSSDPSVMDISAYEQEWIRLVGTGTAEITVTSKADASVTAKHTFEVYEAPAPTSMTPKDVPSTIYKNYKYHLKVNYDSGADPSTSWTVETADQSSDFELAGYSFEYDNQAVLFVSGTGEVRVTAASSKNPSLSHTFVFNAVEGDEPIDSYSRAFGLYDPETGTQLDGDADEYVLELGKTYRIELNYQSENAVPFNFTYNDFYHNKLFTQEFFKQITLADTASVPSGGIGYSLLPDIVFDNDYVFFKAVSTGSQEFT